MARSIPMRDRGFALLEVIVAAALLVVLAAGVSRVVAAAIREGQASRLRAVATVAAADKLEELRSLTFPELVGGADYLDASGASIGSAAAPGAAVYSRQWTAQTLDGDAGLVALRVDVFARDGSLVARLVTVRAER